MLPSAKHSDASQKQLTRVHEHWDERSGGGGVGVVQSEPWQMYLLSQCRAHFLHTSWTLLLDTYPKAKRSLLGPDMHLTCQAQGHREQREVEGVLSVTGSQGTC